ncbi:MAG: FtsQ-type POTRA domain-containing protein, partial [Kineosporiaceae bacterium]
APPRRAASSGTAERFAARVRSRRRRRAASAVAAVLLALGLGWLAVLSPWLVVEQVQVQGLDRVPVAVVHQVVDAEVGRPMVLLDPQSVARRVAALPLVREVEVTRRWPATVVVAVRERVAVAVVPAAAGESGYRLVDRDGVEVESVPRRPGDLPFLDVNVGQAGPGALVAALEVQAEMPPAVQAQLREIGATSPDGVWFTVANGARVVWGDATRTQDKLTALTALVASSPTAAGFDVSAPNAPAVSTRTLRRPLFLTDAPTPTPAPRSHPTP